MTEIEALQSIAEAIRDQTFTQGLYIISIFLGLVANALLGKD